MEQSRNKKLAKDIAIYGIGNIGSKLMTFLLITLLTFFIARESVGYYDLSLSTILLLLPITTLQMRESTFRLLIENEDKEYRKSILSSTFFVEGCIFALILAVSLCLPIFVHIRYYALIITSIYIYSFYEIYAYVVRVIYSPKEYAIMGIINSFLIVATTISLLIITKEGIISLFIGNILSRIITILIIELPKREFIKGLSIKHIKKEYIKEIINYSLPMLFTAICFGFISTSGKFIVSHYLELKDNGDLAIAEKYMNIVQILGITFYQAWQETAVKNYRKEGSAVFFSEVFNKYTFLLSLLVICISFGLRLFSPILIDKSYIQSVNLIFIYGTGAMFYCLALFMEITFQCTKQTSKIFYSILTCAIITPILSIFMIKNYGLIGNVTTICIAFAYLFIFRYFQTYNTIPIKLNKNFYISMFILTLTGVIFYETHNKLIDIAILLAATSSLLYLLYSMKKYIVKKQQIN